MYTATRDLNCGLPTMDDALWRQLTGQLNQYNLTYLDLPQDEKQLFETLAELGFDSFIARTILLKMIIQACEYEIFNGVAIINPTNATESTATRQQPPHGQPHSTSSNNSMHGHTPNVEFDTQDVPRLSEAGAKGLMVARRAALEMASSACTECKDVKSWLIVPKDTTTIHEALKVYTLIKTLRNKFPTNPQPSKEAAIALRDVMVMMATNTYPSCETALQDIALPPRNQQHTRVVS